VTDTEQAIIWLGLLIVCGWACWYSQRYGHDTEHEKAEKESRSDLVLATGLVARLARMVARECARRGCQAWRSLGRGRRLG
jgi:hypothetical protein